MALTSSEQQEIVAQLLKRPKHEAVRVLISRLLTDGLGANISEIQFEEPLIEVRGAMDALLGRTIFEFKTDLRRERDDAERQLKKYLNDRETATDERFVGIATDGATFDTYQLRNGDLRPMGSYTPTLTEHEGLLRWLRATAEITAELQPDPDTVRSELGKGSLAWFRARAELGDLWDEVADHPDVQLKRALWSRLLERVYGSPVDNDDLFFQHTYLTIVAKTMAVHVLGMAVPEPDALLAGRPFTEVGVHGVVESDFFDWLMAAAGGVDLVRRIAAHAARFRLRDVQTDVLKSLYESLVDPEQRHDLGEYYTPDWLAAKMCERAIGKPLEQIVLDPACGSGTFLFHAVKRLLRAADEAGLSNQEALDKCCDQIRGIDIHPVAVQIARVTFLMALGEERLPDRDVISIPVYLGDSLQWNTSAFMMARWIQVEVPESDTSLEFPFSVAEDPSLFDSVISRMLLLSEQNAPPEALQTWLNREVHLDEHDAKGLTTTYSRLHDLKQQGRDHIWGFVARNIVRPAWLSQESERADVIIGNPPWLSYRFMSRQMQSDFREACQERGIWVGQVAQQSDLPAYFFARIAELYLRTDGVIAFVMPYASMSRRQFEKFRKGAFGGGSQAERLLFMRFIEAWKLSDDVQPLFPVPSCVLFAKLRNIGDGEPVLAAEVLTASGELERRDSTPKEAATRLSWRREPWPTERSVDFKSSYSDSFRDGAVVFPSVLFRIEQASTGPLGANPQAPLVASRRTNLEKAPWKDLPSLRGNIESQFIRNLYIGAAVAPYRILSPIQAVIPWDSRKRQLLSASDAIGRGFVHLSDWLTKAEELWETHGRGSRSLLDQIDYFGQLTAQLPPKNPRVVYVASGTEPAVAILSDRRGLCEHALYWMVPEGAAEGRYLEAVLNSETARSRVSGRQARGQWGARHFDKVMFMLPIPKFNTDDILHRKLAKAAERAEKVAASVELKEGEYFVTSRRKIREALREDGVAQETDRLVAELL